MSSIRTPRQLYTVVYDYEAKEEDELNLEVGEVVEVISKDREISGDEGWWVGRIHHGTVGVFPANYVVFDQNITNRVDEIEEIPFEELTLQKVIGVGAFGRVYSSIWRNKEVAVKVARIDSADDPDNVRNCMESEAGIFSLVSHPNIVALLAVSREEPNMCLVMEYARGGALSKVLATHKNLPPSCVLDWAQQIARGLNHLHSEALMQIIHRDLKSSNSEYLPFSPLFSLFLLIYPFLIVYCQKASGMKKSTEPFFAAPLFLPTPLFCQSNFQSDTFKLDFYSGYFFCLQGLTGP